MVAAFEAVREFMFRTVSQITLNYRDGPLSVGAAGRCARRRSPAVGADRRRGQFRYRSPAIDWQVHVYGSASAELAAWCAAHDVPLHVFGWRSEYEAAGLARDALYLLRPDTYVALADGSGAASALDRYFADRGIKLVRPDFQPCFTHLARSRWSASAGR